MTLPLHRFLNYVYNWYVEKMDKETRASFDEWLAGPIPNQVSQRPVSRAPAPTPAQLESEGQEFLSFMGSHAAG